MNANSSNAESLLTIASGLLAAGMCVVPSRADKHPALERWKDFQAGLPLADEVNEWFGRRPHGIGFICGNVSGGLEVLDLDAKHDPSGTLNQRAEAAIRQYAPGVWERLVIEKTPSGGLHLYFRCENPEKNLKLARLPNSDGKLMAVAETRGEGGFIVAAPTPGYVLIQGDLSRPPFLTDDERAAVFEAARSLDRSPQKPTPIHPQSVAANKIYTGTTPGMAYNTSNKFFEVLKNAGWATRDEKFWVRPGKTEGTSATWDMIPECPRHLHIFTQNAHPFEEGVNYTPFAIYAHLECGGDFTRAAKELYAANFGDRMELKAATLEVEWEESGGNGNHPPPPPRGPNDPYPTTRRKPSAFRVPADNDPSVLLGNRYLNRGDTFVLSGTSGIGKSSLMLMLCVLWALGRPAFGIKPNGPLKSLIIQSEDSDGDVAEVMVSIVHCLSLTAAEIAQVDENVIIVTDRANRGLFFIKATADHIKATNPDLVWLNPLQAFIDGDITKSQDLGRFLREGLNGMNDCKFGWMLVHHTTKPATGKDRTERLWHEVMYDMAGGAEIINHARAIASLRPADNPGDFNLVLAKRGRRAGVIRQVEQGVGTRDEPVTTIPLRHAMGTIPDIPGRSLPLPIIFWEGRDPDPADAGPKKKTGRPKEYDFNDWRNLFPAHSSNGLELRELHRRLNTNNKIPDGSISYLLKKWEKEGLIEKIVLPGIPFRYRISAFMNAPATTETSGGLGLG